MVLIKRYKNGKPFNPTPPKKVDVKKGNIPPTPLKVDRAPPTKRSPVADKPAPRKKRGCGCGRKR